MSRHFKKMIIWFLALMTALVMLGGCGSKTESQKEEKKAEKQEENQDSKQRKEAERGEEKTITITVTHSDGSQKEFSFTTDYEMLGDLLREEDLADGIEGASGFYVTEVDGEKAEDTKQEWWMALKDGEMIQSGVDYTPLEDGDSFELAFSVGYN